jgi:hypothetical protein
VLRRQLLYLGAAAAFARPQKPQKSPEQTDVVIAGATDDQTVRVGLVLSTFKDSEDHYGAKVAGLPDPRPVDADLSDAQLNALVRKALAFGTKGKPELSSMVAADDWVVIKVDVSACGNAAPGRVPGSIADLRVVRSLIGYLAENKCGARITIAEGLGECGDAWSSEWDGAFGGLSYKKMVAEFSRSHPSIKFELMDLDQQPAIALPVEGKALARRNTEQSYFIPKAVQQCDRLISVAPLKVHPRLGAALTFGNYLGIAPATRYGTAKEGLDKLGEPAEIAVDLFSYHPADYALLGGSWGMEEGRSVHHNLIVAGASAVSVDAVAAAVMGFAPGDLEVLPMAEHRGFGSRDVDAIWVRGNEIEQARRPFRKPAGWTAPPHR